MKNFYTLLLVLTSFISYSQITYKQGYFINNNGEKTTCLIKDMAWKNSPLDFEYKLAENSESLTATVNNVAEFNVDNSYKFKRFTLDIELSSNYVDKLDVTSEPVWQKKTLFLKVLLEGDLDLYQFEDGNIVKYFYGTGDKQTATQLLFKKYVVDGMIKENNNYRQQLFNLMRDRINNVNRFKNIDYKKSSLTKLFSEYNGESNNNYTLKHNKSKITLKFTPAVGFTSFAFKNAVNKTYNFEMEPSQTYSIGAEMEYILPFNNNKWSLFINPSYNFYNSSYKNKNYSVETDYKFLQVPIGVRYSMFFNSDSKVFINGSYNLNFLTGNSKITYNNSELEIGKNSSFALGAGYGFKNYSIEARYILDHSILGPYTVWTSEYNSLNVILGYRFL
ncbi:porin family protein [Flavobacterium beibuense]|uniref:tRNA modification GTPase n=1 Tax=Flavobacterium beibuense TaxID=657326 RepID=A0A444W7D3_9FLAO|nr:porin family protein [Flavobacterium beibuense]RYJ41795.1 tRNA modification GTPase [Flavobacterium beibuense]